MIPLFLLDEIDLSELRLLIQECERFIEQSPEEDEAWKQNAFLSSWEVQRDITAGLIDKTIPYTSEYNVRLSREKANKAYLLEAARVALSKRGG